MNGTNEDWRKENLPIHNFGPRAQGVLQRLKIFTVGAFIAADWRTVECPQLGATTRALLCEQQQKIRKLQDDPDELRRWLNAQKESSSTMTNDATNKKPEKKSVVLPSISFLPSDDDCRQSANAVFDLPSVWPNVVSALIGPQTRDYMVLTRRFNLDGGGKSTLSDLGKDLKVSRERVRQVEEQALRKIGRFLADRTHGQSPRIHPLMQNEISALQAELSAELPLPDVGLWKIVGDRYGAFPETARPFLQLLFACLGFHFYQPSLLEASRGLAGSWLANKAAERGVVITVQSALSAIRAQTMPLSRYDLLKKVNADLKKARQPLLEVKTMSRLLALCSIGEIGDDWYQIHFTELPSNIARAERIMHEWAAQGKTRATIGEIHQEINLRRQAAGETNVFSYTIIGRACSASNEIKSIGKSGVWTLKESAGETRDLHEIMEEALSKAGCPMASTEIQAYVAQRRAAAPTSIITLLLQHRKFQRVGHRLYALRAWGYPDAPPARRGEEYQSRFEEAMSQVFMENEGKPQPLIELSRRLNQELNWSKPAIYQRLRHSRWLDFTLMEGNRLLAHWRRDPKGERAPKGKTGKTQRVTQRSRVQDVARDLLRRAAHQTLPSATLSALLESQTGYCRPVIYGALRTMPDVQRESAPRAITYRLLESAT